MVMFGEQQAAACKGNSSSRKGYRVKEVIGGQFMKKLVYCPTHCVDSGKLLAQFKHRSDMVKFEFWKVALAG